MYEPLTNYIPEFEKRSFGECVPCKKQPDGSFQMGYVHYHDSVSEFIKAVYNFNESLGETGVTDYQAVLQEHHLDWSNESLNGADVSQVDGRTVLAMVIGVIRAERFCDGVLLEYLENGTILKWLNRLRELDSLPL